MEGTESFPRVVPAAQLSTSSAPFPPANAADPPTDIVRETLELVYWIRHKGPDLQEAILRSLYPPAPGDLPSKEREVGSLSDIT